MDTCQHNLNTLFAQLGLANNQTDIDTFIEHHKLKSTEKITEASFWNTAQKQFIQESLAEDGDWSEVIDTLDTLLRE
tara:strand:+ start:895 stop:1125 length:231 start_codon:yes stop_codon:yes gene_type:complete